MAASSANQHDACDHGTRLLRLLQDDDIDAAIDAGLIDYTPCPGCQPAVVASLQAAQRKLLTAWLARDRYQARTRRLARLAAEREQKRRPLPVAEKRSTLPAAAAAILARAKAKAAERGKP